jgi:hypothetical protein
LRPTRWLIHLINSLAPLVQALDTARKGSPFYHYAASDPLRNGIAAAAAIAASLIFERRDFAA